MTAFPDLAPAASASAFGFGMVIAVLGSIQENLSEILGIPKDRIARWLSATHVLLIPLIFLAGLAADSIIDNVLGGGTKSGYAFAAAAGTSTDLQFTSTGTPSVSTGATQTGARFFFTDETQVVRFAVGAAATSGSGAIGN